MASTTVLLRISPDQKAQIKKAAGIVGKSFTTFMVEAALKRAEKTEKPPKSLHGSMPPWFLAICHEAAKGGSCGYDLAGYKLASGLACPVSDSPENDEWKKQMSFLRVALAEANRTAVWEWMHSQYPELMALVPVRRKEQFIDGVFRAYKMNEF